MKGRTPMSGTAVVFLGYKFKPLYHNWSQNLEPQQKKYKTSPTTKISKPICRHYFPQSNQVANHS